MFNWLLQNLVGIFGILVGGFIAYHVYFLSERIGLKDRLAHKDEIIRRVEPILQQISKGINRDAELINVKKYFNHYPNSNDENRHGLTYIKGELKALRFDGIEFFTAVKEVYKKPNGRLTLDKTNGQREEFNIFEVGIIPYEWVEYIDPRGDEFSYRPQFFVKFKGLFKTPYKYVTYYKESSVYHEGSDPLDMKYGRVDLT